MRVWESRAGGDLEMFYSAVNMGVNSASPLSLRSSEAFIVHSLGSLFHCPHQRETCITAPRKTVRLPSGVLLQLAEGGSGAVKL